MSVEYRPAYVAETIGERLVRTTHEHLLGVRIDYVFRSEAAKSMGRIVLGRARKITGLNAFLAADDVDETPVDPEPFFVIELAEDCWRALTDDQRDALVDHELSHCWAEINDNGERKLSTRGHDLEEFVAIVHRHGLWKSDVERFVRVGSEKLSLRDAIS